MTKKKWLGSLLNFFVPGLGSLYSRNVKKGILTYILFFVVVFSLRFIAYNFILFLISLTLIVGYYLYLIISGYRNVQKNKVYEPLKFDRWYVYVLLLVFHWVLVNSVKGPTLDRFTPINFASIPTPAMDPALQVGDILAFNKTKSIERNNVIIFWFPDDVQTMYIKRCIGLPGDSLQIRNSKVLVNGAPLREILLKYKYLVTTDGSEINSRILEKNQIGQNDNSALKINGQIVSTYVFKEDYYFMMGDNRHNSLDSRYWGLLPQELVIGKAMYLYWGRTSDRIGKKVI